jgi:peptide/nickel transport system permease protein
VRGVANTSRVALLVLVLLIFAATLGSHFSTYDPLQTEVASKLQSPDSRHLCGTDQLGRDICIRILYATRLDLGIALGAVLLAAFVGSSIGAFAGFLGGWIDRAFGLTLDAIMAFPLFILAMGIVAALGNSVENVIYATAVVNLPFYARMVRAEVNRRRNAGFVDAARVAGNGTARIVFAHLLPCALPAVVVQMSLTMSWAILNAAALSFVGLGVRPPAPEWGIMVAEGSGFILTGEWWVALFPGLALLLVALSFNVLGDGLRDLLGSSERQ